MASIKVLCPAKLANHHIPSFNRSFCAGIYDLDGETDLQLIKFLLRYPTKSVPINPQEVADLGIMTPEEVAGFGYEIMVRNKEGEPILDKETGKPVLAEPDAEKAAEFVVPEGVPPFPKLTLRELKEWMDDPAHPVKYEEKWHKEDFVRACEKTRQEVETVTVPT